MKCCREVLYECCRGVLEKSVGGDSWRRRVLEENVGEECCREVL